jgi:hypothetical protein
MDNEKILNWLKSFEMNWKSKNTDSIVNLFDKNVIYYETPSQRLNSLQEIKKEWDLIKEQNEINLKFDVIDKIEEKYVVLWKLSFLDNQSKTQNFKGKYEIILDNNGNCVEFRQYE